MTDSVPTLASLLPELFPIISSHLPLYARPLTLLALALTNRRFKEIIIPRLLFQQVWLEGDKHILEVLRMLNTQAEAVNGRRGSEIPVAHHVRRLSISADIPKDAKWRIVDIVSQLQALINIGGLHRLVSLAIHMTEGWYRDYDPVWGFDRLDSSFWRSL